MYKFRIKRVVLSERILLADNVNAYSVEEGQRRFDKLHKIAKSQILLVFFYDKTCKICDFAYPRAEKEFKPF